MSHTYADRKRTKTATPEKESAEAQPSLAALRSGAAQPTQEQTGHRVDLPDAMRAKMENAFGADLSAVKLYESRAVADAGAEAVTRGSDIAFAPGLLDFSSYGGQSLLGHELSHVVSQARGEVTGGGFLNDRALEARADREGAMAASGQQIAMPTASMSTVSAASAAGPMQAKKPKDEEQNIQISNPTPVTAAPAAATAGKAAAPAAAAAKAATTAAPAAAKTSAPAAAAAKAATTAAPAAAKAATKPRPPVPNHAPPKAPPKAAAKAAAPAADAAKAATTATAPAKAAAPVAAAAKAATTAAAAPAKAAKPRPPVPNRAPPKAPPKAAAKAAAPAADAAKAAKGGATSSAVASAAGMLGAASALTAEKKLPESGLGLGDLMEPAGSAVEQVNDITDKAGDIMEDEESVADALVRRHGEEGAEALGNRVAMTKNVTGLITGTAGTYSSGKELKEAVAAVKGAKEGGSQRELTEARYDVGEKAMDLVENSAGTAESGAGIMAMKLSGKAASAAKVAEDTLSDVGDYMGVIKGGYGMLRAGHKWKSSADMERAMAANQERLEQAKDPTKSQATARDMSEMAKFKANEDKTDAQYELVQKAIETAGSGAGLALSGGGGVAADVASKLLSAGVGKVKEAVHDYKQDRDQHTVLDKQTGLADEVAELENDPEVRALGLKHEDIEAAIIRRRGAKSGEIGELYNMHARQKVDDFMDMEDEDEKAKFGKAAKIDLTKPKSKDALYHHIGGTDKEYEDVDADPFEEKAKKHKQIMDMGGYGKYYREKMKQNASAAWEKTKAGVGSAVEKTKTGLGNAWEKTKTGASKAAGAVKDFATNAETRKKAWESVKAAPGKAKDKALEGWDKFKTGAGNVFDKVKTGASNAWDKTKTGVGNAWEKTKTGVGNAASAVKDFATNAETRKKAMESVKAAPGKAWEKMKTGAYENAKFAKAVAKHKAKTLRKENHLAMDKLSEHRENYDKMNWVDRAKWSIQNPLARMRMSTQGGKDSAKERVTKRKKLDFLAGKKKKKEETGEGA